MKNYKLSFIFFFLIILNFDNYCKAKIENKIIIRVGSQIITNYEIQNKILTELILANLQVNQKNINSFKKKAHDDLINLKLKKKELSKKNIDIQKNETESYLRSIYSNNLEEFKNTFKINNLDYNIYLDELETELKWRKFIFFAYQKRININEQLIEEEIQNLQKKKNEIIEFKISEIEILNNENSKNDIDKIKEEIKNNGFNQTAFKFSISSSSVNEGDLGWIKKTSLDENIVKILDKLEIDAVSSPIIKQNSIIFLKLTDKRKIKNNEIDLKKIKAELIKSKQNEIFSLYSSSHLSKLKNQTLIQYSNEK